MPGETGGMETYARRLVPALAVAGAGTVELVAYVNREAARELAPEALGPGVRIVRVDAAGRSRVSRVLGEQLRLPALARRHRIDLLHSLGSTAPAIVGRRNVVTVHDVIYATQPEAHTATMRLGMRVLVPLTVRSADRVITDSRAAADDIRRVLGVHPERIDVVHIGGGLAPGVATPEAELRQRYDLGERPLVLSVSARRPHKNVGRLLDAFAGAATEHPPLLVIPGYATSFETELRDQLERLALEGRVRLLGWVPDADLEGLYRAAVCFVFPSLAEGFGLPVLEAMERGLPVACSDIPVLHEVAGPAARYFDPLDVDAIRAAIEDLLGDRELGDRLAATARERAGRFTWERAAAQTLESYRRAMASPRTPTGAIPAAPRTVTRRERAIAAVSRVPPLRNPAVRREVVRRRRHLNRLRRRAAERAGSDRFSRPALHGIDGQLERLLPERGVFVEAGANDGYQQSNTYHLERFRGWTGVLVEPIPVLYEECRRERPNSRVFNCALVAEGHPHATVTMRYGGLMSVVGGALGSDEADAAHVDAGSQYGWDTTYEINVPARTLSSVLDEAGVQRVDLLSLDVEGFEESVLRGLDLTRHRPRVVLVEMLEPDQQRAKIEAVLGEGYELHDLLSPFDHLYLTTD